MVQLNQINSFLISTKNLNETLDCQLFFWANDVDAHVNFRSKLLNFDSVASNYFEALILIRLELEKLDHYILCNGSRVDAYPSRMGRQMNMARKIYLNQYGKAATLKDLVDIFAVAPRNFVSSVSEQHLYHLKWLESTK
ncbi:hypothetical protein GCM10009007_02910 [Formosimonas limnophila]|uniref:Uncharacterized protein n=1 Tax=Formosimonas limnophila TaxID=1384487 RepID=A0A8J3CJP6_9BURK|nr:hypothetical protein [Formosimonas limnophila]GHA65684.1 hypothetical protein GCM10009007_02910 [Formosimonas limnophila]